MFQLLISISRQDLAARQLPAFLTSFAIGAFFYHFGNFALECMGFLATWCAIDGVAQLILTHRQERAVATRSAAGRDS